MKREIIYPKDLQVLTGKSLKSARNLLEKMKAFYGKEKHHFITVRECSRYLNLDLQIVLNALLD